MPRYFLFVRHHPRIDPFVFIEKWTTCTNYYCKYKIKYASSLGDAGQTFTTYEPLSPESTGGRKWSVIQEITASQFNTLYHLQTGNLP